MEEQALPWNPGVSFGQDFRLISGDGRARMIDKEGKKGASLVLLLKRAFETAASPALAETLRLGLRFSPDAGGRPERRKDKVL